MSLQERTPAAHVRVGTDRTDRLDAPVDGDASPTGDRVGAEDWTAVARMVRAYRRTAQLGVGWILARRVKG